LFFKIFIFYKYIKIIFLKKLFLISIYQNILKIHKKNSSSKKKNFPTTKTNLINLSSINLEVCTINHKNCCRRRLANEQRKSNHCLLSQFCYHHTYENYQKLWLKFSETVRFSSVVVDIFCPHIRELLVLYSMQQIIAMLLILLVLICYYFFHTDVIIITDDLEYLVITKLTRNQKRKRKSNLWREFLT
jgi:hypothetical protein